MHPHLGGLSSSGLGATDLGNVSILGGLSREFYHRIYQHYQQVGAWNWQTRASYGQAGSAFNAITETASFFEPKVAEAIFSQFLTEQNVPVITGRLDLAAGIVMNAGKISHLRLEDGREFSGRMFIDASYEGDLLPGAGVAFAVGREANVTYHETYNGIQAALATNNQLGNGINPYVTAGNAASGLLSGVAADAGGTDGSGDTKLQAYCFRMVLTDVAANRVMIPQPAGYNEADYELLFRAIEAGQTSNFFKLSYPMDSHNVQRHVKNGMVKNEGNVQMAVSKPYPISYRSIIPKRGECSNLLVPWSLSATHMAFGSIRMEPVFMGLSQSAAIAASMAIDRDIAVQDLAYAVLRPALLTVGCALGDPVTEPPTTIVDNTDSGLVTLTDSRTSATTAAGFIGTDYLHDGFTGQGTRQAFYRIPSGLTGAAAN